MSDDIERDDVLALLQQIATAGQRSADATEKLAAAIAELAKKQSTQVVEHHHYPQPTNVTVSPPSRWPNGTFTC